MNWTLIIVALCLLSVRADQDLDTVKQLLTDLKTNVQLDIEALDAAWELHKKNKLSVIDALGFSAQEQRGECQKKDDDVESKKRDIKITNDFVAWMQKRQSVNSQRLGVLESNRCQASNNYVHDIKNYKIALALVRFLREQLDILDKNSTPAQKQEFLQKVSKFMQIYQTGKLLTMVEEIQINDDGSYILPNIEGDEQDLNESVLTSTRGNKRSNKILLQQAQTTVISDGDDKADSAVVLIPSQCDDSIKTVVVVQNDDGTGSDDDDIHIRFTNGGGYAKPAPRPAPHPKPAPHPHVDPIVEPFSEETTEETVDGESVEEDDGEVDGEDDGESEGEGEVDDHEEVDGGEVDDSEEDHGEVEVHEEDDTTEESGDNEEESGDHGDHGDNGDSNGGSSGGQQKSGAGEEEEDLSDIRKLLDAIERHTKKSLDREQEDEVRSSMIYIDFKLHVELENQYFDKQISGEKENLIKLTNQLTSRVAISRQCNARLKQITIAHQVSQEDYNDSYQHYLELRKQKEEELATFEDVYRIYTNQVA